MWKQSPVRDLGDIALFAKVVELRSLSAAARAEDTTTSAVSKRIAKLEERLGARLLERTTRKVAPTEAGAAFYARAARILAEIDEAQNEVGAIGGTPRGTLRVSAPVVFGAQYLAPLLAPFLRRYPAVRVELSLSDRFVDLLAEGVDVALRIGTLEDSSLPRVRVGATRSLVVAAPAYLAERGRPEHPTDLLQHDCVRYTRVSASREWRFREEGRSFSLPVVGPVELDHGVAMLEAAVGGAGIAKLPHFLVAEALAQGRLESLLEEFAPPPSPIHLLAPPAAATLPRTKAFLAFALDALRTRLDALARPSGGLKHEHPSSVRISRNTRARPIR